MIQKIKRPVSILLVLMMVVGMFTILPITAGAAPSDFSTETKTIFVTDSQGWDDDGAMNVDYWKVKTTGYDSEWNPITETVSGDRVAMTYLFNNTLGQSVYGATIPDDANWVKFTLASHGSSDTTQVYDGSWWYIDGNSNTQVATASAFDTTEQTNSLSAAFVNNTGADEYYVLDGHVYFVSPTDGVLYPYNNTQDLYVAKDVATGNWYYTVNDAVQAAGEGGTVQLVADIKGNVGIDGDYTTTLDLNGHNITNATGTAITLYSAYPGGKTFTIKDTVGTGTVTSTRKYNGDACISDSSGREVVIEGGNYVANAGTAGDGQALYVSSDQGWTINGGTFNGDVKVVSELDVTGGTINGDINATGPSWKVDPAEVTISGGTVTGSLNTENGSTYEVSGGTFANDDVSAFVTADKIQNSNGAVVAFAPTAVAEVPATFDAAGVAAHYEWTDADNTVRYFTAADSSTETTLDALAIPALVAVAQVGTTKYETFAEAVDARESNNDVITLLAAAGTYTSDDHTEFPIKVAKSGKSVTVKIEDAPYYTDYSTADGVTTFVAIEGKVKYTSTNGTVTYKGNIDYSNMGGSGTYQLLDDITANSRIVPGLFASNVTVDLNGHTLTSTANDEAFLFSRAGSAASHNSYTITNGTIVAPGDGVQLLADYADLTLDKVTINAGGDYGIVTNGSKTGNNITVTDSDILGGAAGIYKPSNGTLTLTDTDVEGNVAVYVKSGTVAINGGTFTGTGAAADYTYNGNGINPTGDAIVIDSCGYPGGAPSISIGGNPTINSDNGVEIGDYAGNGVTELAPVTATDNTMTLPEGLEWVETETPGVYTVDTVKVAEVNNVKYETFEAAVAARATNDDVITLLASYTGTYNMAPGKLVVDKNGFTFNKPTVTGAYIVNSANSGTVYTYTTTDAAIEFTSTSGVVSYKSNIDYSNLGSSGTYKLLKDITCNSRIVPGMFASNVTVDLNGHTLTSTATDEAFLFSRAGSAASHNSYTITNGTIIAPGDGVQLLANYADLTLDGVTINASGDYGIVTNGSKTGNNITVTDSVISGGAAGIYKPSNGALTLTDTSVEGNVAVYVKSGTVAINGGTFTGTGAAADYTYNGNGINPTGDAIVIDSCGYPGGAPSVSIGGNPTINSTNGVEIGDYAGNGVTELAPVTATDNELTLPEGLKWVETEAGSGVYEVAPDYVAEVNGDGYMTFAEAVAARTANTDVITLIKAAGTYTGANTEFPIKVETNGKTVTVKVSGAYLITSATADGVTTYTVAEAAIEYTSPSGAVSYQSNIDYSNLGSSGTYKLLKDITAGSRIVPGTFASNVTIDLNGHTLTSNATDQAFRFSRNGSAASRKTFTITDTSTNGGGKIVANSLANSGTSNTASVISASGNYNDITIENVTIEATQGIGLLGTNQTLTINNCDITVDGTDYALATNGSLTNGAVITVTDSSIESTAGIGVYLPGGSTATFTDTDVTGTTGIYQKSGSLTIDGGTITGNGAAAEFTHNGNGANATGDAIVVESCNYPNGTPETSIGNTTIASTNGKQVGDYTYGEAAAADVTATSNTLTLPEGLKWVETATPGVYEVGFELFPGYSVSVGGTITMNVYINTNAIPGYATDNSVVKADFTWDSEATESGKLYGDDVYSVANLKSLTPDANGWVKVAVPVNAAQMANTITAVVTVNNTTVGTDSFSVKEYGETILADTTQTANVKTLVKAMLNYGAMAQTVFNSQLKVKPTVLANSGAGVAYTSDELNDVTYNTIISAIEEANDGNRGATVEDLRAIGHRIGYDWTTTSVIFLEDNTIRHYFDDIYETRVKPAGEDVKVQDTYFYYVEKKDIASNDLDKLYTFSIGGEEFQYSVLDYAAAILDSGMTDDAKNLARALYLYNQAANACIG